MAAIWGYVPPKLWHLLSPKERGELGKLLERAGQGTVRKVEEFHARVIREHRILHGKDVDGSLEYLPYKDTEEQYLDSDEFLSGEFPGFVSANAGKPPRVTEAIMTGRSTVALVKGVALLVRYGYAEVEIEAHSAYGSIADFIIAHESDPKAGPLLKAVSDDIVICNLVGG